MVSSCTRVVLWALGIASVALSSPVDMPVSTDVSKSEQPLQMDPNCNLFYIIQKGDTCWDIISRNENTITIKQLMCWNPDINPWCSNLIPGRNVCIGVNSAGSLC
ncbi:hypothetical protein N7492_009561 [Penicillium capsulatum]|uniref:LysM domain-containing protein n=1 Tax=Penicillium capsulatum TaxID=69766 RepID=A0A9W9HS00_9EURO|nr:hypothetical protein N7492_009561 [Penicillium capsulatum]KAJ6106949.1 hypothetical protein N7512_010466 [Penicillium capsulatum]